MSDRIADQLARTVRAAVRRVARPTADIDLLDAFQRTRDPAAFAGLVQRHGPLVLATCRAILPNAADADDACQAAFVVLHRKARTIRDGRTLGGWLFRVARRTALEVKANSVRRRERESRAARPEPVTGPDLSWREACAILHEELDRLPPRYRLPLILCYLEGKTRDETATELGWTPDSVRGRINRGRLRLRANLEKRGVTLSAGLLATVAVPVGVSTPVFAAIISPSPIVAAAAQAVASTSRILPIGGSLVLMVGLFVGVVVLGAGRGGPPPPSPPAKLKPADGALPSARKDTLGDPLPEGAVARLGTLRLNHGEGLSALLFTPDGKSIVSVGRGQARVWDAATGVERLQFSTGTPEWDDQVAITPDGKQLIHIVQRFQHDPLHVFDLTTGKEQRSEDLPSRRTEMSVYRRNAMSSDGHLAALLTPKQVLGIDIATGKQTYALTKFGGDVTSIAFAGPDRLVTTDKAHKIEIWNAKTGEAIRSFDNVVPAGLVAASNNGKLIATLEHNQEDIDRTKTADAVHVWDADTGKAKHDFSSKAGRFFMGVGFSQDGASLYAFSTGRAGREVTIWDMATGKIVTEIHVAFGQAIALSPDGKRLAAGDQSGKFDLWDLANGKSVAPAEATSGIGSVYLSRDGSHATTVSTTRITNWDVKTARPLASTVLPEHVNEPPACRFTPNGRFAHLFIRGDKDSSIETWDVEAGKAIRTIPLRDLPFGSTVAISPDSTQFAILVAKHQFANVATDKSPAVQIRDLKTGKEMAPITLADADSPTKIFFIDNGRTLVVSGKRTVGYAVPEGMERFAWSVHAGDGDTMLMRPWASMIVSPDGTQAAYIKSIGWKPEDRLGDQIELCDLRTGKLLRHVGGKLSHGYSRLAFSNDGRLLAAGDGDDVHVWETATGKQLRSFHGHRNWIETLAFSGDSRRLASASHDSTVIIWDLAAGNKSDSADPWADLESADATAAYAAMYRLADAADDVTVPLLRKHLQPMPAAEVKRMRQWIADLNSDQFRMRDKAFKELADLGLDAGPALRTAMTKKPSVEAANRIGQLLAKLAGPPSSGAALRTWRALAVLEMKGTPTAIAFLNELAVGDADSWLMLEANASLRRVEGPSK